MARKSNKTSHVLNLLAGGEEPAPDTEKEEKTDAEIEAKSQESTDKQKPTQDSDGPEISIITAGSSGDDPLSDLIKGELEGELEKTFAENSETDSETENPPETVPEKISSPPEASGIPSGDSQLPEGNQEGENEESESHPPEEKSETPVSTENPGSTAEEPAPETGSGSENQQEDQQPPTFSPATAKAKAEIEAEDSNSTVEISGETTPSEIEDSTPPVPPVDNEDEAASTENTETDSAATPEKEDTPETSRKDRIVVSTEHLNALLYPEDNEDSIHYRFINVMEYVVKDMILDYMKKFDMCTCERCVVDTMALALTFCSSKYIVVDKHTVSPLLNYYSSKYTGDVTVALTRACTMVNEKPRH